MDCAKIGTLIRNLRTELGLTQQAVADALNISHKTVSKWERGLGLPDVSLLPGLSMVLGADIQKMLEGELAPNRPDTGNLRRVMFYACPSCGNILFSTGKCTLSCCGRRLSPLAVSPRPENPAFHTEENDTGYYVTMDHEMSKEHYVAFIACVAGDRVILCRLYPEQSCGVWLPRMRKGTLYAYCVRHGMWTGSLEPDHLY